MQVWSLLRGLLKTQDSQIAKKLPSAHNRTNLSGYIFAAKACMDNMKNLLNSSSSSTCPHNMVNFGSLAADIGWRVWGTPANFNGYPSWLRYCTDVAHRRSTKLCTMFGRLLSWYAIYRVSRKRPPKYNGVVFEILGKHDWNFYNRI